MTSLYKDRKFSTPSASKKPYFCSGATLRDWYKSKHPEIKHQQRLLKIQHGVMNFLHPSPKDLMQSKSPQAKQLQAFADSSNAPGNAPPPDKSPSGFPDYGIHVLRHLLPCIPHRHLVYAKPRPFGRSRPY